MLQVQALDKRFGHIHALENVSFRIHDGEILGLIGPNGAGKSTLFECLAGLLPADSGALLQDGQAVPLATRHKLLYYVPDGICPWPAQPLHWVLDFTVGFLGGRAELVDQVIDELDLRQLLRQPIGTLSKGQRKRALLAIGLLTRQPALLIDEPFEGLDLRQTRDIAVALRRHAAAGRTLFLSIHQINDAARLCDRFVLLNQGQVRGEGTVAELAEQSGAAAGGLEEVFLALT